MLAKKTSKNQITLPRKIIKTLLDTEYFDVSISDNAIRLMPVKITPVQSSLDSVRDKIKRLGLTEKEVGEAIQRVKTKGSDLNIQQVKMLDIDLQCHRQKRWCLKVI